MIFRERLVIFLATGLALGNLPFAPGSFGSLLGLGVCYVWVGMGLLPMVLAVLFSILSAVWIAGRAERLLGRKDDRRIVIDEVAGMMVALVGLPADPANFAAGFILFRALDVLKPFPARLAEARMTGGWGIVMDDVIAGIYCNVCLRIIRLFVSLSSD
jgi:phosphatidylglycerophosphatase A